MCVGLVTLVCYCAGCYILWIVEKSNISMETKSKILDLSFEFSLKIIALYKELVKHHEYVLSRQLLKSGTSIGANVEEANAGQTKKDFIAKMCIAAKEARETRYWLKLLDKSKMVELDYLPYLASIEHIINTLTKIIKTSQQSV